MRNNALLFLWLLPTRAGPGAMPHDVGNSQVSYETATLAKEIMIDAYCDKKMIRLQIIVVYSSFIQNVGGPHWPFLLPRRRPTDSIEDLLLVFFLRS
jgi:hypothetical protein